MASHDKYKGFVPLFLGLREEGIREVDAFEKVQAAGYDRGLSTLYNQIALLGSTGRTLGDVQRNNGKRKLDEEKMQILHDWIRDKNSKNEDFQRRHVQKFILDQWGVAMHITTVGNVLKRLGMTQKTCQAKTAGFMKTNKELKEIYWDFIRETRASRKLSVAPSHIRSLDVTHTRKPAQSLKTFSPNGSGKQKSKKKCQAVHGFDCHDDLVLTA